MSPVIGISFTLVIVHAGLGSSKNSISTICLDGLQSSHRDNRIQGSVIPFAVFRVATADAAVERGVASVKDGGNAQLYPESWRHA